MLRPTRRSPTLSAPATRWSAGTSYDDYPAEAKSLPKIGDFANPSVEKIASFQPDLILAAGGIQDGLRSKFEKLGVQVYVVDPTTYEGVMASITEVGQLAGTSEEAQQVVDTMKQAQADVQGKVGSLDKATTFLEIYSEPLMTAGSGTFIDDMITIAGGRTSAQRPAAASPTSAPRCWCRRTRSSTSPTPGR